MHVAPIIILKVMLANDEPIDLTPAKFQSYYAYSGMNAYPDSLGRSTFPPIRDQPFSGVLLLEWIK
jgi:hypothetical protein